MSSFLLQSIAGSIPVYLELTGGTPATSLGTTDVTVALKKSSDSSFTPKSLTAPAKATASIGSGANGTVNISVDTAGTAGNAYTVTVALPAGTSGLTAGLVGTAITVNLAVNAGVPDAAQNTATLIAAAVTALGGITATASGTGADSISAAAGPTTFSGGLDGDLVNLGNGFYELDLSATDTDTLGALTVRVMGPTIRTSLYTPFIAAVVPPTPNPTTAPPMTTVFGYVYGPDGKAVKGASVSARILATPTVLHPGEDGLTVSSGLSTAETDNDGFFSVSLIRGSQVDFAVPAANYRRTFRVPSSSTNVFDIP
jgi:hypothetical protein